MTTCPFCLRLGRFQYEKTSVEGVVRFEPLNPVTPGHMLFVPFLHYQDALEYPRRTAQVMESAAEYADGPCNLITSVGSEATQTVFHLHVHLVPRRW